jgi:hypothetical protein
MENTDTIYLALFFILIFDKTGKLNKHNYPCFATVSKLFGNFTKFKTQMSKSRELVNRAQTISENLSAVM